MVTLFAPVQVWLVLLEHFLKEVPDELSATSLPQQWHKPRGRRIKPQAVVSMTLANPIKSPADRKRKPIFTEVSEETVPNSTPNHKNNQNKIFLLITLSIVCIYLYRK
jgi:hypothetical protein